LQLETERADRKEIEAKLFELKQNSAPATTLAKKLTPDAVKSRFPVILFLIQHLRQ
jgi:hypothetical protein